MLSVARGAPGAAGPRGRGAQSVACRVGDRGRRPGRGAGRGHPGRRRGGGRRGGRGDAGRGRADRPRARPRARRAELHGCHRPRGEQRELHRRRVALPATRRGGGHRPVGLGQRRVRPFGQPDRLLADHQLRVRGRPRHLRLPRLLPRRPGDAFGHPVRRGLQAARAVPRAGRPRPRAGQADHGGQGRAERPGAGGGHRPLGLAGGRDTGHRCRARCGRRHPLSRPRRAARDGRAGRGRAPDRPAGRSWPDRRRDRVDRRGVADRRSRAADRARPAADPGLGAGRHPRGAADHGLHREPARPMGRRQPRDRLSGRVRGDGGVGCLRRPRPRPRLPVPFAAVRGRDGQRGHRRAPHGHRGSARHPARLRVADLGRAAAGDEGVARYRRGRCPAPARRARGVPGDRRGRPLGGTPCRADRARSMADRLGRPGQGSHVVWRRPEPDPAGRASTGGRVGAREPGARGRRGDHGGRGDPGAGCRDRRGGRAADRPSRGAQARCHRAHPQDRTWAGSPSGCWATMPCTARP